MKFNLFKFSDKNKNGTEKANNKKTGTASREPNGDISNILNADPARPHGPAKVLTLDGDDQNSDVTLDEIDENPNNIKLGEIKASVIPADKVSAIKTVPLSPAPAAVPLAAEKSGGKAEDNSTTDLNSLFSTDDEEENPLAALINSLPDVTARELMDDLDEIHRIIKEWKPNQGGEGIPR